MVVSNSNNKKFTSDAQIRKCPYRAVKFNLQKSIIFQNLVWGHSKPTQRSNMRLLANSLWFS